MRLKLDFYRRPVLVVARDCIGKVLVHRTPEGEAAGRIVEAEAYRGPHDLAAHSARGRRTQRTEVMFGPPGRAYVYQLYGTSWAMNLVVGEEGEPHAVLIRAVEPVRGIELIAQRRDKPMGSRELSNGPGKLTSALGITGAQYGFDLCGELLFLETWEKPAGRICRSPRINMNIETVGQLAARRRWRFYEGGNRYVSVSPRN